MNFAILYGKSTTGKIKTWKVEVIKSSEEESLIRIEHGYSDGKKQEDIRSVTSGKNIGKANETTPYEQATSEAKSDFNKKCDEGYAQNIDDIKEESSGFFLPMLAHKWDTHSSKIRFPAYCQPKLDGCLSADTIVEFEDGSFDFVFIDGNHEYSHVLEDITEWTKKVKPGGIVCGHDYKEDKVNNYGVIEAVNEYVHDNHIAPWFILRKKGLVDCWMFIKQ